MLASNTDHKICVAQLEFLPQWELRIAFMIKYSWLLKCI